MTCAPSKDEIFVYYYFFFSEKIRPDILCELSEMSSLIFCEKKKEKKLESFFFHISRVNDFSTKCL